MSVERVPLAVIGGGNMGQAIVGGGLSSRAIEDNPLVVAEPDAGRRSAFEAKGVPVVATAGEALARLRDYEGPAGVEGQVVLAVKPQVLGSVAAEIGAMVGARVVISILAGTPGEKVRAALGGRVRVVRAMPNLPAKIRQGATAVCLSAGARAGDDELARHLFESVGLVVTIDESLMDAFTALAGSGPAYVFYLAEAMVKAGIEMGFEPEMAMEVVREVIAGSGALLGESFESPDVLRRGVTSKGGTTEAAAKVLDGAAVMDVVVKALVAARDRGRELAR